MTGGSILNPRSSEIDTFFHNVGQSFEMNDHHLIQSAGERQSIFFLPEDNPVLHLRSAA